jgi:hypothetical protein
VGGSYTVNVGEVLRVIVGPLRLDVTYEISVVVLNEKT